MLREGAGGQASGGHATCRREYIGVQYETSLLLTLATDTRKVLLSRKGLLIDGEDDIAKNTLKIKNAAVRVVAARELWRLTLENMRAQPGDQAVLCNSIDVVLIGRP